MGDQVRVAVYSEHVYSAEGGRIATDGSFALFLAALGDRLGWLLHVGRVGNPGRARYDVGPTAELASLPYYRTVSHPFAALPAMLGALPAFWRALDRVDLVWLWGPHPLSVAFTLLALARRRHIVLGVRQNTVEYARRRHPRRRLLQLVARLVEGCFRLLARRHPVVVVGPDLASRYAGACRVEEIAISLVREAEITGLGAALARSWDEDELVALSVGRLDEEKNPMLLAEIAATLNAEASRPRWRLVVCGEGTMLPALSERVRELGLEDVVELRGYVPFGPELAAQYARAHALLHVSWTEGLPQVLYEGFAAGLPTVATDVGGITEAVGDAVLAIPPGDAPAAAAALTRLSEPELRSALVRAGLGHVRGRTIEGEAEKVANLFEDCAAGRLPCRARWVPQGRRMNVNGERKAPAPMKAVPSEDDRSTI